MRPHVEAARTCRQRWPLRPPYASSSVPEPAASHGTYRPPDRTAAHVTKTKRGPGFDTTRGDAESIRVPYRRKTQQLRRGPRLPDSISRAIAGPDPIGGAGVRRSGTCPSSCSSTTEWMIRRRCGHRSGRRVRQRVLRHPRRLVCRSSTRLRPSGHRRLAALPHVGGAAELRSGIPPHGLAAATPGCRPGPNCPVPDSTDTKR